MAPSATCKQKGKGRPRGKPAPKKKILTVEVSAEDGMKKGEKAAHATRSTRRGKGQTAEPQDTNQEVLPALPKHSKRKRTQVALNPMTEEERAHDRDVDRQMQRQPAWTYGERVTLFLAVNARKHIFRDSYKSHSLGKYIKGKAWEEVAAYVNGMTNNKRSGDMCRRKVAKFCSEVKAKHTRLMQERRQTGNGQLDADMYLASDELMALDYIGREVVIGIDGLKPTRLVPRNEMTNGAPYSTLGPWNPNRITKPDYSRFG